MKTTTPLAALAALTTGILMLAGCGKPAAPTPSETPAGTPSAQSTPAPAAAEEKVLNLFCWTEYVPQTVVDAFTKETGIKVNVQNYESNEEMLQKLLSGGGKVPTIGEVIQKQFTTARNPPFGSALGTILLLIFIISLWLTRRHREE